MNGRTNGGRDGLFRSNNSGCKRRPEMWLIGRRELVRPSESRGYLSIDPRPREASTAFRVIRGRWEQIRVLAFLRFRVRLAAVVAGHRTVCNVEGRVRFVFVNVVWPSWDLRRGRLYSTRERYCVLFETKWNWNFDLEARKNRGLPEFCSTRFLKMPKN